MSRYEWSTTAESCHEEGEDHDEEVVETVEMTTMQTTLSRRPKPTAPNPVNLIRNGTLMINHRQTSKNLLTASAETASEDHEIETVEHGGGDES